MLKLLALTVFCVAANATEVEKPRPPDIETFKRHADLCEHFSGEWDNDLARQRKKQIEVNVVKDCGAAQKELHQLRKKYRGDRAALADLEASANSSVKDYRK